MKEHKFLKGILILLCVLFIIGFLDTGSGEGALEFVKECIFFWREEDVPEEPEEPEGLLELWEQGRQETVPAETVPEYQDPARIGYGLGQCADLRQDAHVVAFFLDDWESQWTPESASAFAVDTIRPALDFIQKQASLYGYGLEIPLSLFYTGENHAIALDGIFDDRYEMAADGNPYFISQSPPEHTNILQTLSQCVGYSSYEEMHAGLQQQLGCRQIAYLIISNKDGWSYSRTDTQANGYSGYEYSIFYTWDQNGAACEPKKIAREVLRLFGAESFVRDPQGRANSFDLICREYPYAVMANNSYPFSCNFVDGFTAYALGWRDTLPPEFLAADLAAVPQTWDEPYRPEYNQGTCRDLSGNIFVLNIYIDDNESWWDVGSAEAFQNNVVNPAMPFLSQQAANWGVNLDLETAMYVTDAQAGVRVRYNGIIDDNTTLDSSSADILDQAALSLGFSSKAYMTQFLQEYSGRDQIVYMLMVNKSGRCYAHPDWDDDARNTTEFCVIFSRYWTNNSACLPFSVAHELLHLFGAEDLYAEDNGERGARAAIANKLFPRDIMGNGQYYINDNRIDSYTAYAIGWTNAVPYECTTEAFWEDEYR